MVEVVQHAPAKECKCGNCKATLRYEFKDIVSKYERDYTGDGDMIHRIKCPNCGHNPAVPGW